MEEDDDIYNCDFQPLIKVPDVEVKKKPRVEDVVSLGDHDDEVAYIFPNHPFYLQDG